MSMSIESITQSSLSLALDAAVLRHNVISYNIANSGVVGFIPLTVKFSSHLKDERHKLSIENDNTSTQSGSVVNSDSLRIEPEYNGYILPGKVQLDSEVAKMAQNAIHYQALLKGLNRHMSILSLAISEGKR